MFPGFIAPGVPLTSNLVLQRAAERDLLTLVEEGHRGGPGACFLWGTPMKRHVRECVLIGGVNREKIRVEMIVSQQCFLCGRKP